MRRTRPGTVTTDRWRLGSLETVRYQNTPPRSRTTLLIFRWGPCSRPCGGGIRKSERYCDSPAPANGGQYCTGRSVRYMSCNIHNCDESVMDFRAEQCAKHNGDSKGIPNLGNDVKWDPKYGERKESNFNTSTLHS